jgi:hypothetical protein
MTLTWDTSCTDWEKRALAGKSLVPCPPLFPAEAASALDIFRDLRIVDAPGSPTIGECCKPWVFDFVGAIFGSCDPETGRRLIRYFLAPTIEVAGNSFQPTRDMIKADEELIGITEVEGAVDAVQRRVASFDNKDVGPVRVTCLVTVGQRIVKSGLLDAFHERHPGMVVELLMEQRMLDLSKGEADIAIRGGTPGPGALVDRKIAELPWGIYASRAFIERHGRPAEPRDIQRFAVVELIDELKNLPAVRWMSLHASQARIAARGANVPSVHLVTLASRICPRSVRR